MRAIDLFAGLGGFTEGAEALGIDVVWAANHWSAAVETHAANHPRTAHLCQDLHQADFSLVPDHDILLASPSCVGHTRARGKEASHHDAARSTAWAVVSCAEVHRPRAVVVENVPEMRGWALYPAWRMAMSALGYQMGEHVLDAADVGVPQHRKRLFLVGVRDRMPPPLGVPREAHVPASAFLRWDDGTWSPVDRPGRAASTLSRVDAGRARFGGRFLVAYYGTTEGGRSAERPIGTLTTHDRYALIDGDRMRMLAVGEARAAMGFRADYRLPPTHKLAMHMLGNAVCPPMASWVISRTLDAA